MESSPLTWEFLVERVTGIEPALSAWESVQSAPSTRPDLRNRLSVSDHESPRFTRVNGPLMARGSAADDASSPSPEASYDCYPPSGPGCHGWASSTTIGPRGGAH